MSFLRVKKDDIAEILQAEEGIDLDSVLEKAEKGSLKTIAKAETQEAKAKSDIRVSKDHKKVARRNKFAERQRLSRIGVMRNG